MVNSYIKKLLVQCLFEKKTAICLFKEKDQFQFLMSKYCIL